MVRDGWVVAFLSSFPDGFDGGTSRAGSPIPLAGGAIGGWLTGSADTFNSPRIVPGIRPDLGDSCQILDADAFRGSFSSIALSTVEEGLCIEASRLVVDGTVTIVPEPATVSLLGIAIVALATRRRRRLRTDLSGLICDIVPQWPRGAARGALTQ